MSAQTDPFADASAAFVKPEHLVDRLLLVIPQSVESRPSTLPGSQGKMYESVTTDVIILDGEVTDLIDEVPMTVENIFFSGQVVVGQLKPKVKDHTMVLGRLGKQPSKTKGFGDAWVLNPPTEDDKKVARPAANDYLASRDPFEA